MASILNLVGLKANAILLGSVEPNTLAIYKDAVVDGMQLASLVPGVVALITGVIAFIAMGPRDPVRSVWDHADERQPAGVARQVSPTPAAAPPTATTAPTAPG